MTGNEIRGQFIDYFRQRGHDHIASSALIPEFDPTLLFTNAGMVQFKDVFLGNRQPPAPRAVTVQKCVRAGGKHNDLESVGKTARHHTFFEMLGNFSFGDYFKAEAIDYAWEFLTGVLGVDGDRLWPTVYVDDDEAARLWVERTPVSSERVIRLGEKDNYWSMGDVGPCGPCSELIYDRGSEFACGEDCAIGVCDCDRWLELWNLVFMMYERASDGTLTELPRPNMDTGMGLERIASVLQGVGSNYDTDLFRPLIDKLAVQSGVAYEDGLGGMAHRVIADHVRCCCFLLAEGIIPGNEGRNYVLRRILRRAVRYGRTLGLEQPFMYELVPVVAQIMGGAYPELVTGERRFVEIIHGEEQRFGATLYDGMKKAEALLDESSGELAGSDAFLLYDTYGFPLDLVRDMAEERGMTVDEAGFGEAMAEQKERARRAGPGSSEQWDVLLKAVDGVCGEFVGEDCRGDLDVEAVIVAVEDGEDGKAVVVLDRTPFYAEGGGQVADRGVISGDGVEAVVVDVRQLSGGPIHVVDVKTGSLNPGLRVRAVIDRKQRLMTAAHHTATHLLHKALHEVVGPHAVQSGSLVTKERLRFDYAHHEPLTDDQIVMVEDLVNWWIWDDYEVRAFVTDRERAEELGAVALFGEKYGETVRVVEIDGVCRELCGGTHVGSTGMIGMVLIESEGSIGSGMRRIEAVAGEAALDRIRARRQLIRDVGAVLKCGENEIGDRLAGVLEERRQLERERDQLARKMAYGSLEDLLAGAVDIDGIQVVAGAAAGDGDGLRSLVDSLRDRLDCGVIVLGAKADDRAIMVAGACEEAVARGVHCGKLVGELAKQLGGGGGGRPDWAQAGGKTWEGMEQVLAGAAQLVRAQVED